MRQRAADQMNRALASQWVSTAASEYRDRLGERVAVANSVAEAMEEAAEALTAHARQVREVLSRIAAMEELARGWFDRALAEFRDNRLVQAAAGVAQRVGDLLDPVLPDPPWQGWPYTPFSLPPSGDRAWLEVGDFLRRAGVLS